MLDGFLHAVRGIAPALPWIALAVVVMRGVAWVHIGGVIDPVDHFVRAIVAALLAAITTSLWFGALENGHRSG